MEAGIGKNRDAGANSPSRLVGHKIASSLRHSAIRHLHFFGATRYSWWKVTV
jgi:hypothetical protein